MIEKPKEFDERTDSKKVKNIRTALCVFFVIITACISLPFVLAESGGVWKALTDIELFVKSFMSGNIMQGFLFLMFAVIPAAGFFIAVFDRKRMLKGFAGLVCSVLGIVWITVFVTPANIWLGSLISLLLYLITFILSMVLLLAKAQEKHQKALNKQKKKEDAEHVVIKLDKNGASVAGKKTDDN